MGNGASPDQLAAVRKLAKNKWDLSCLNAAERAEIKNGKILTAQQASQVC